MGLVQAGMAAPWRDGGRGPGPDVLQPAPLLSPLLGRGEAMPGLRMRRGKGSLLGLGLSCPIPPASPGSRHAGKGGVEAARSRMELLGSGARPKAGVLPAWARGSSPHSIAWHSHALGHWL